MQTTQGITKNIKYKTTTKKNRKHNYNPDLFSYQTINFDGIILNGGQNHSTKHPSEKTTKPKNTTAVKGTKTRPRSKNPLGMNEGPILLNVVENKTKSNSTSKPHKQLFSSTGDK